MSNLLPEARTDSCALNFSTLQSRDTHISRLLHTVKHVVLYEFDQRSSIWTRLEVEGQQNNEHNTQTQHTNKSIALDSHAQQRRLLVRILNLCLYVSLSVCLSLSPSFSSPGLFYLVERVSVPYYRILLLHRRDLPDYIESVTLDMLFECQQQYILFRVSEKNQVMGLCFHQPHEAQQAAQILNQCVKNIQDHKCRPTLATPLDEQQQQTKTQTTSSLAFSPSSPTMASSTSSCSPAISLWTCLECGYLNPISVSISSSPCCSLCHAPSPFSSSSNPKKALVIGVAEYDSRPLANPTNDAEDMTAKLQSIEFDVTTITGKTATALEPLHTSIQSWVKKLIPNDIVLFYFSGHGTQDDEQRNYLLPSNNMDLHSGQLFRRAICLQEQVLKAIQRQNVKCCTLLLDCCRNNAVIGSSRAAPEGLSRIRVDPLEDSSIVTIAYACAPGKMAEDGGGRNGLFTKHLLKWVATPNLELDAALKKVARGVIEDSEGKQRPYRDTNSYDDIILYKIKEEETVPVLSIPHSDLEYFEELGDGGFGIVYRGRWMDQDVAIKKMRIGIAGVSEKEKAEFMHELKVHYSLRTSEFVVPLYGACMEPGHYAIVMKYMAGGHLLNALRNGLISTWKQKWDIAVQVLRAINFLHMTEPQVLHRDIKPANFLLTKNMKVKVSDFGLSKLRAHSSSHSAGRAVGTIRYTAPEKFKLGSKYTSACDMYSVGIVLWEIATGETPYGDEADPVVREAVREGQRLDIPASVPVEYRDLIAACWEHDPVKRIVATEALQRAKQGQLIEEKQHEMNQRQTKADPQRNQIEGSGTKSTPSPKQQVYDPDDPSDMVRVLQSCQNEEDEFIATVCESIATLAERNNSNRILVARLGGIQALLSLIRKHASSELIIKSATKATRYLALNADNQVSVARLGGLELLLSVMKQQQSNAAVVQEVCGALFNLSVNSDNQVTVIRLGGLELLLSLMKDHQTNAAVMENTCRALFNLSVNGNNKVSAPRLGGFLSVMKQHQANAAMMETACGALGNLAFNVDNKVSLARLGGLEVFLSVMKLHQTNAAVMETACGALLNLSVNANNKVSVARLGGLELLLSVMREHQANVAVLEYACGALWTLSFNADNQVSVARLGGLELLLSVMKVHQTNASVMEEACGALGNLSMDADNQLSVARLGGLELLLSVMREHQANAAVLENACAALSRLSANAANQISVARVGGLDLLLSVMKQHQANSTVTEEACGALCELSFNADNQTSVARLGGLEVLLSAMRKHPESTNARDALQSLARNASNAATIRHLGGNI